MHVRVLLHAVVGYWAYGAEVNPFLLFANSHPRGLVVSAELAAAIQVQLVSQVGGAWAAVYARWMCQCLSSCGGLQSL